VTEDCDLVRTGVDDEAHECQMDVEAPTSAVRLYGISRDNVRSASRAVTPLLGTVYSTRNIDAIVLPPISSISD